MPEGRDGEQPPVGELEPTVLHLLEHPVVARGVDDDGHAVVVLRRRADHRRSPDVDLLDALGGRGTGGDRLGERVEVGHQQVERRDPELAELFDVLGTAGVGEQPGVHRGVQRLDPAVEALGEAGELLDGRDGHSRVGDPLRGGPGGHDLDAERSAGPWPGRGSPALS